MKNNKIIVVPEDVECTIVQESENVAIDISIYERGQQGEKGEKGDAGATKYAHTIRFYASGPEAGSIAYLTIFNSSSEQLNTAAKIIAAIGSARMPLTGTHDADYYFYEAAVDTGILYGYYMGSGSGDRQALTNYTITDTVS